MKKLYLILLFFEFGLCHAQSTNRIGIIGGGLYAKSNLTNQDQASPLTQTSTTFGNIYSFFGGIVYEIKVTNEFSIKSKLLYVNKGWTETKNFRRDSINNVNNVFISGSVNVPVESIKSKETYRLSYLELPLNFTFYTPIGKSLLSFGVGPYLSLGLSGRYDFKALESRKHTINTVINNYTLIDSIFLQNRNPSLSHYDKQTTRYTATTTIVTDTSNYIPNYSSSIRYKPSKNDNMAYTAFFLDYGAALEASLEFRSRITFTASYTLGITNVIKEHYGALQNRHRVIMLGVGYYLKTRRKLVDRQNKL